MTLQNHVTENLIAEYQHMLATQTLDSAPYNYAVIQNNLGLAYAELPGAKNFELSITCYENALLVYTPEQYPDEYAAVQNNRGVAYGNLAVYQDEEANLLKAIGAYLLSLKYRTLAHAPLKYAQTLTNLGMTYYELGDIEHAKASCDAAGRAFWCMGMVEEAKQIQYLVDEHCRTKLFTMIKGLFFSTGADTRIA